MLVVDDDERVLAAYKRTFTGTGRTVHTANDSPGARTLASERQFDLAVIDLRLRLTADGLSSGLELVEHLRTSYPEIGIALVSGYLSVTTTVAAVRAGADVVLFKPVTCEEILRHFEAPEQPMGEPTDDTPTLAQAEWEHVNRVLADCKGNISMAARRLGIYRSSLQRRLRRPPA
ncbi:MAG: response regulator [Deltaproteobacteria bacterium]|nr:response regulator [Deltaproteobacteria bacterium]MCW5801714.1 response regulator [Deltaproteobacteria bacterium]